MGTACFYLQAVLEFKTGSRSSGTFTQRGNSPSLDSKIKIGDSKVTVTDFLEDVLMPRAARVVVPGVPHHVTQRGNRREPIFFEDGDQLRYLSFLRASAEKSGTVIWAYCLMPNHVHLIVVPQTEDGLRGLFADAHRKYTNFINWRHQWVGHLWQGRFASVAMDEEHLERALRYVAQNPVRAKLVERAEDWRFSSVPAYFAGKSDGLVDVRPVLDRYPNFRDVIGRAEEIGEFEALRSAEKTGQHLRR
jgi:putative transposase